MKHGLIQAHVRLKTFQVRNRLRTKGPLCPLGIDGNVTDTVMPTDASSEAASGTSPFRAGSTAGASLSRGTCLYFRVEGLSSLVCLLYVWISDSGSRLCYSQLPSQTLPSCSKRASETCQVIKLATPFSKCYHDLCKSFRPNRITSLCKAATPPWRSRAGGLPAPTGSIPPWLVSWTNPDCRA